jgi:hypothetical protein
VLDRGGNTSIALDRDRMRQGAPVTKTIRDGETNPMVRTAKVSVRAANAVRAVVPTMPYRNPIAMIEWLTESYGFERCRLIKSASG